MSAVGAAVRRATSLPVYPVAFATAVVLHFALAGSVHAHAVGRPLAVAIAVVLLTQLVLWGAFRSPRVAALVTIAILLLLLARGLWVLLWSMTTIPPAWQAALWMTLLAATAFLAGRIVWRSARRWSMAGVTRNLNVASGALLVVVVGSGVLDGGAAQAIRDLAPVDAEAAAPSADAPDILLVLLDGYPRADTLQRVFGLDNSPFVEALRDRGFDVASRSRSNYTATELTFMSMFHMAHLTDLAEYAPVLAREAAGDPDVRNLINENPVFATLRAHGYTTIATAPGIERVTLRSVDYLYDGMQVSEFEYHLLRSTAVGGLWAFFDPSFMARSHRDRVLDSFEYIERLMGDADGGRFVFAHLLSPHMPAVLNRDGSLRPVPYADYIFRDSAATMGITAEQFVGPYRDQLLALNDRVIAMLDAVIAENSDAVVILMSDHGSAAHADIHEASPEIDERLGTLFAARTPGEAGVFAAWQTPINVFPRLFNAYFGTELPDRSDATFAGLLELTRIDNPDAPD